MVKAVKIYDFSHLLISLFDISLKGKYYFDRMTHLQLQATIHLDGSARSKTHSDSSNHSIMALRFFSISVNYLLLLRLTKLEPLCRSSWVSKVQFTHPLLTALLHCYSDGPLLTCVSC